MTIHPNTARDDEAIAVNNLTVAYRTESGLAPAISDVSFNLSASQRLAVVGESGSGKTTLATAIAGLLSAHEAEISCAGARISGQAVDMSPSRSVIPVRRPGVSMIFQDAMTSLDPVASVAHQFRTVLDGKRRSRRKILAEAQEWIERVGIHDPARVMKLRSYEMSGGMRQRIMIALALCKEPAVLIADEPTSALDASVSRRIMDLILSLTKELGTALIIITHDVDLALSYTDKTLVAYRGQVMDLCATEDLLSQDRSRYTKSLMRCVPRLNSYDMDLLPTLVDDAGAVGSVA